MAPTPSTSSAHAHHTAAATTAAAAHVFPLRSTSTTPGGKICDGTVALKHWGTVGLLVSLWLVTFRVGWCVHGNDPLTGSEVWISITL